MPRRVVTPENLSRDFDINTAREDGPVGLNLNPAQFVRDPETGQISTVGGGGEGSAAMSVSVNGAPVLPGGALPTDINFSDTAITGTNDGDGTVTVRLVSIGDGPLTKARRPITNKAASAAVLPAEEGHAIHFTNTTEATLTVPGNALTPIPVGAEFEVIRLGAGAVNITAVEGVMINGVFAGTTHIVLRYSGAVLRKIAVNEWLVMGAIVEVEGEPPEDLPTFLWADVFADHTATPVYLDNAPGLNWTGFGTTKAQPAEVALEWFMRNVLPIEAPDGAIIDLTSPTGVIHLSERMTPPPGSHASNWTLRLTGNSVERSKNATTGIWGQLNLWGEVGTDPAVPDQAVLGANAVIGDTTLTLGSGASSTAFLAAVDEGSIVEIRTNTTGPGYHPIESRATLFVASKNVGARTITLSAPLPINAPISNPVGSWEIEDPTTLQLLAGSMLSANANRSDSTVTVQDASQLAVGDWVNVSTIETLNPGMCQFLDGVGGDDFAYSLTPSDNFPNEIQINEELHRITGIAGNVLTLDTPLGKNKLTTWKANVVKILPLLNSRVVGGTWRGTENNAGAEAWEHQYIWCRYMVDCIVEQGSFDTQTLAVQPLNNRRMGQAVRMDTGYRNIVRHNNIGRAGSIDPGQGYGVSLRLGERFSSVFENEITGCRHSVEFWSTSGGCRAEGNLCTEDTSSSIDTHGSWNVGVLLTKNTVRRSSAALYSSDSGGATDAFRIGNPKFMFDEDMEVIDNDVEDYKGVALALIPGARRVLVDEFRVRNVDRILSLGRSSRHPSLFLEDITIRNVTGDGWADRAIEISHANATNYPSARKTVKGLTLENWVLGGTQGATHPTEPRNIRILDCEDVTVRNVNLVDARTMADAFGFWFERVDGLVLDDVRQNGGERGIQFRGVRDVSGDAIIRDLTAGTPLLVRADTTTSSGITPGPNTGTLTVTHNQTPTPSITAGDLTVTPIYAA